MVPPVLSIVIGEVGMVEDVKDIEEDGEETVIKVGTVKLNPVLRFMMGETET